MKKEANDLSLERDQYVKLAAERLTLTKFGLERFSTDNELTKFYTGLPTAENMIYCFATKANENRRSSHTMQIIDEMFMFLVRIKLGLFVQDLAFRFQLHISTVSRKLKTWVNYLYFLLGTQPIWPSRQEINACMPDEFKELYYSTRVILDCTEVFVQTPSSLCLLYTSPSPRDA